jgi:prepilin-type N-terminal cleavage/methylation domain-containing protein
MIKMLTTRKMNKKGFTLIELIVVIAILAILAIIAIPRLAGFTDKAKQADDRELASIVQHSVATLYASGEIKELASADAAAGGSLLITKAGPPATYALTDLRYTGGATDFQTEMNNLIGTTDNLQYYASVTIYFDGNGEIDTTKGTNGFTYTKT